MGEFWKSCAVCVVLISISNGVCYGLTYSDKLIGLNAFIGSQMRASHILTSIVEEMMPHVDEIDDFYSSIVMADEQNLKLLAGESSCLNDTLMILSNSLLSAVTKKPMQQWALQFIDASGKISSGILDGNINWIGSYDECLNLTAVVYTGVNQTGERLFPFTGKYCQLGIPLNPQKSPPVDVGSSDFPIGTLVLGLCIPSTCSGEEIRNLYNSALSLLGNSTARLQSNQVICRAKQFNYDTRAIIVLCVCSVFLLLMVAGTMYDVFIIHQLHKDSSGMLIEEVLVNEQANNILDTSSLRFRASSHEQAEQTPLLETKKQKTEPYQPGLCGRLLMSFSVYTNGSKLLSTNQGSGVLSAVNGIRFLSISWVILGHVYAFGAFTTENVLPFLLTMMKRWSWQAIINAPVAVDTFFILSGLLLSYLSLKEMQKCQSLWKFKWGLFYFHRIWRLTPPYMLIFMVYVSLYQYWSDGPLWPQEGLEKDHCQNYWWKNLLYINNFFPTLETCMAWSWYLANDMQFFVVSPLMLIPLYYSGVVGIIVCLVLLFGTMTISGVISSVQKLPMAIVGANAKDTETGKYFDDYYVKPYCRMGPYIIGIMTGYVLYRTNCKIRMNRLTNLAGWAVATACCMSVLYGPYDSFNGHPNSNEVNALYNALARNVWALGVSWVIFACSTGYGGIVNALLSWKIFIPLGRLTYCVYLLHPVIMSIYFESRRQLLYMTDLEIVFIFCGSMVLCYAAGFVASLAFESPFMGLEKAIFHRDKNDR
ncbi:hypothetical protein ACJMK2_020242 [Sinanodonta woodiana]|uniref:Nose resistant-to-fluoxetine protein N-terminal domain-containing protein n=1 Tax=Sinanodonta woodiana TaxID=1069815 RepID=A0ABD3TZG5_SINWO